MSEQKKIYLVFSSTQNKMGHFIRRFTGFEYNHVSVSIDSLRTLYSFARYYRDTPFSGGFVRESKTRYLCEKHPAKITVCALTVTEEQYKKAKNFILDIDADSKHYLYNLASAAISPIHIRIPISRSYTCVEFAAKLLAEAGLLSYKDRRKFFNVRRLYEIFADKIVYEGEFNIELSSFDSAENYTRKNPLSKRICATCLSGILLIGRFLRDIVEFID